MTLFAHAISSLGTVLLPMASALLLEELTFGGLVRLLLTQRPETRGHSEHTNKKGDGK